MIVRLQTVLQKSPDRACPLQQSVEHIHLQTEAVNCQEVFQMLHVHLITA